MEIKVSPGNGRFGEIAYVFPETLTRTLEKADPAGKSAMEKMIRHTLEGVVLSVEMCLIAPVPMNALLTLHLFQELDEAIGRISEIALALQIAAGMPSAIADEPDPSFDLSSFEDAFRNQDLDPES